MADQKDKRHRGWCSFDDEELPPMKMYSLDEYEIVKLDNEHVKLVKKESKSDNNTGGEDV